MAEFKGVNATKRMSSPSEKVSVVDQGGRVRKSSDEYTVPTGGHSASDTVVLSQIPKGAKVMWARAHVKVANGAALTMDLGWKANGSEAADATGFMSNIDANAVGTSSIAASSAGLHKQFAEAVDVVMKFDGAAAAGLKFVVDMEYTLD